MPTLRGKGGPGSAHQTPRRLHGGNLAVRLRRRGSVAAARGAPRGPGQRACSRGRRADEPDPTVGFFAIECAPTLSGSPGGRSTTCRRRHGRRACGGNGPPSVPSLCRAGCGRSWPRRSGRPRITDVRRPGGPGGPARPSLWHRRQVPPSARPREIRLPLLLYCNRIMMRRRPRGRALPAHHVEPRPNRDAWPPPSGERACCLRRRGHPDEDGGRRQGARTHGKEAPASVTTPATAERASVAVKVSIACDHACISE
jgi:hypothetical protein